MGSVGRGGRAGRSSRLAQVMRSKAASKYLVARLAGHDAPSSGDPVDPCLPTAGNHGYRVVRYDLDRTYEMSSNNLRGEAVITATATEPLEPDTEFTLTIRYPGIPRPIRGTWGEVRREKLTDRMLVANQPSGTASCFPCDDQTSSKAPCRSCLTTDSPYRAVVTGAPHLPARRPQARVPAGVRPPDRDDRRVQGTVRPVPVRRAP